MEEIGFYNPMTKEKVLKLERIKYWLSVGAKPSATIFNFFVSEKILEGKKIAQQKKSKKPVENLQTTQTPTAPAFAGEKPAEMPVQEKPAEEPEEKPEPEQK